MNFMEKEKHAGGRPSKYKKKFCKEIIEYFRKEPYVLEVKKEYFADGSIKSMNPSIQAAEFPTFQGFADSINVHIDTLHEWCNKNPEFSEAYKRAKQLQEKIWLVNGMQGLYNAQFAQFFGKNCLGYADKQEIEHSGQLKLEDVL